MPDIAGVIRENLARVQTRIEDAARQAGRDPKSIKLVAVTKYVDAELASFLVDAGCADLGESRPQELWQKSESLMHRTIRWHLIGHLQRNKVAKTVACANLIHSGDSERLLAAINDAAAERGQRADVLLETNITADSNKTGMLPTELLKIAPTLANYSSLNVCGLMAMSGLASGDEKTRSELRRVRELRDELQRIVPPGVHLSELSMGMSDDFEIAIAEGATMVRIGSALFTGISQ